MKYLKQIAFTTQEYKVIQESLQYYIQTLSFSKRINVRKTVAPLLAGSHEFKITKSASDIVVSALKSFSSHKSKFNSKSKNFITITNSILKKLDTYLRTWSALHPSASQLKNDFKKVTNLHKGNHDRQALDLLFKQLQYGEQGCYSLSCLSSLGLQALYEFNNKSMIVQFCILKLLLSGVKATESKYQIPSVLSKQFTHFQKLNVAYLIGHVNKSTGQIKLEPVSHDYATKFLQVVNGLVNKYIKKHN